MANEVKVKIVLEGVKKFEDELKRMSKMSDSAFKGLGKLGGVMEDLQDGLEGTGKQTKKTADDFEDLESAMDGMYSVAENGGGTFDDLGKKMSNAGDEGEGAGKGFESLRSAMGGVQQVAGQTASSLSDIGAKAGSTRGDISALGGELRETGGDAKRMGGDAGTAGGDLKGLGADASNTKGDLGAMGNEAKESGGKFDALKGAASGLADKLRGIADLAKAAATAIGGTVGVAVANTMSIDGAIMKVNAGLGASGAEAAKNEKLLKSLFKSGRGGAEEMADAILDTKAVMKDMDDASLEKIITNGLDLQRVRGADFQDTMRAVSILMKQFGIDSTEAMDLVVFGMQNGLNYAGDYLDTVSEYSVQYEMAGLSAQEFMATLIKGADKGVHTTDLVADALKDGRIEMTGSAEEVRKALERLGTVKLSLPEDFDKLQDSYDKQRANIEKLTKQIQTAGENRQATMMDEASSFQEHVKKQENAYNKQVATVNKYAEQLAKAQAELANLDEDATDEKRNGMAEKIKDISTNLDEAKREAEGLKSETDRLVAGGVDGYKKMGSAMKQLGDARTADNIEALNAELAQAESELANTAGMMDQMRNASNGATQSYEEFLTGILEGDPDSIKGVISELNNMEDATLQNEIALALFKTKFEDLGPKLLDSLDAGAESMEGYTGAAARMSEEVDEIFSVKLGKVFNTFRDTVDEALRPKMGEMFKEFTPLVEEMALAVGPLLVELMRVITEMLPHITKLAEKFTEWLKTLDQEDIENFVNGLSKFAVIGTVVVALARLVVGIVQFIGAIKAVIAWLVDLYAKGGMFAAFLNGIKAVIGAVVAFIAANPLAVAIAAALAVIVFLVIKHWDTVKEWLAVAWEFIKNLVVSIGKLWLKWQLFVLESIWKAIEGVLLAVEWIGEKISSFVIGLVNKIGEAWGKFWGFLSKSKDKAAEIFSGAVSAVFEYFTKAFQNLKDFVSGIWEFIGGVIDKIFDTIKVPHFKIEGSWDIDPFDGDGISMPKVAIDWYEKGGIFQSPQVIGVGENGDEAVIPLNNKARVAPFAQAVAALMPAGQQGQGGDGGDTIITGNTFNIREEADILKVAKELHRLEKREKKMR